MPQLKEILKYTKFLQEFYSIKRTVRLIGTEEHESDAEHSWQLAMLAWYLIDTKKLTLNLEK